MFGRETFPIQCAEQLRRPQNFVVVVIVLFVVIFVVVFIVVNVVVVNVGVVLS